MKGKAKAKPKATRKRSLKAAGEAFAVALQKFLAKHKRQLVGVPVITPDGRIFARVDAVATV